MTAILWLLIVLAIVTLVGHGIWMLLAKLFSKLFPPEVNYCPACQATLITGQNHCHKCGWQGALFHRDRMVALRNLQNILTSYSLRWKMDPQISRALNEAIESQHRRWTEEAPQFSVPPDRSAELAQAAAHGSREPALIGQGSDTPDSQPQITEVPEAEPALAASAGKTVQQRIDDFLQRRQADDHRPAEAAPALRQRPRRSWSELLAAFMEERHIRWGELVGGLLIVFCSTALVISFWSDIAERPFLKFFVFNGVTAALFGLGLYAHGRWRLETTSHGVLLIAALLVPLNFLAIASFSIGQAPLNVVTLGGEIFSVTLFACLLFFTARVVLPAATWLLTASVMVPSIVTLVIRRHLEASSPTWMYMSLAAALACCYIVVNQWVLLRGRGNATVDSPRALSLLKLLGLSSFATLLPLALLVHVGGSYYATLRVLSPLAPALGLPAVALGLFCWRKLLAADQAGHRTVGTSVGALGVLVMVSGLVLGWPDPQYLLPAAILNFVLLSTIAVAHALPQVQVLATACLSLGLLVGWLLIRGHVAWITASTHLRDMLATAEAALVMTGIAAVICGLSAVYWRLVDRRQAFWHLPIICALAATSIVQISVHGLGRVNDVTGAVWIYTFYGALSFALAMIIAQPLIGALGAVLLLLALIQGIVFTYRSALPFSHPWLAALLIHAAVTTLVVVVAAVARFKAADVLQLPARFAALITSLVAAAYLVWLVPRTSPLVPLQSFSMLLTIWMLLALVWQQRVLAVAAQVALSLTVVFGVAAFVRHQAWVTSLRALWLDPRSLQIHGLTLVALALLWFVLRVLLAGFARRQTDAPNQPAPGLAAVIVNRLQALIDFSAITLDRVLIGVGLVLLVALASYGAAPGAMVELSPVELTADGKWLRALPDSQRFELAGIPHRPALSTGSWALMGAIIVALVLGLLRKSDIRPAQQLGILLAILVALSAAVPLIAGQFEAQAAVASALRWLSAAYLLVGSIAVWSRDRWLPRLPMIQAAGDGQLSSGPYGRYGVVAAIFLLAFTPLAIMLAYVAGSALLRFPPTDASLQLLVRFSILLVVVSVLAIGGRSIVATMVNSHFARFASLLLLVLAAAPLIAVSMYVIATALQHQPIHGPNTDSIFVRMGTAASYAVPIFVTTLVLVGYALRERHSGFAFAGGLLLCVASTATYILSIAQSGVGLNDVQWVRLAQVNAAAAALYGIAWTGAMWFATRREETKNDVHSLLAAFTAIPVALHTVVLTATTSRYIWTAFPAEFQDAAGDWAGWASLLLSLAALSLLHVYRFSSLPHDRTWRRLFGALTLTNSYMLLLVVLTVVCTAARWDNGNWLSYHTLMLGLLVSASAPPLFAWLAQRLVTRQHRYVLPAAIVAFSTALAVFTLVVALGAVPRDPQSPWWTIGTTLGLAALGTGLACGSLRRGYLFAAAAMMNTAASLLVVELISPLDFPELLQLNMAALTFPVPLWVWLETRVIRPYRESPARFVSLHALASAVALLVLFIIVACGLLADYRQSPINSSSWKVWVALASSLIAVLSCHWDARMRSTVWHLYIFGLVICGAMVDTFDLSPDWLLWTGSITLAAYSLATSYLWSRRQGLSRAASQLGIPISDQLLTSQRWILPANGALVMGIVFLSLHVQLHNPDLSLRILSAKAILAQALAVGLLARGERRTPLQYAALLVGVIGAIAFSWSWLEPGQAELLNYVVNSLAALVFAMAMYGLGFSKIMRRTNEWTAAAERIVPLLAGFGILDVAYILSQEVQRFRAGVPVTDPASITIVIVSLLGIALGCLAAALLPGRDPFRLSERQRTAYIYITEIVIAMLFLHVRVTMPWLFRGWFTQYWPMLVMLLAFIGVALSEAFRRQKREILAEPLERTGAFLPVLPVISFWMFPSHVHFSIMMFAAGGVYLALATLRRSFAFGALAALAANVGLWYYLNQTGITGILQHPQLWLIPPALCVLIGAYLNEDRLSESQLASLRYSSAAAIYVSSTADIFLNGVGNAPWLPLVLGGLSLAGIFAGIWLRVRGFLFLGTAFLVLALFTIIWYAAVDLRQTWIWAATGIITGVLIIALFAIFEKKRQEVLRLVENLKDWRP